METTDGKPIHPVEVRRWLDGADIGTDAESVRILRWGYEDGRQPPMTIGANLIQITEVMAPIALSRVVACRDATSSH